LRFALVERQAKVADQELQKEKHIIDIHMGYDYYCARLLDNDNI